MKGFKKNSKGQAIVEYIIIIVIVAVAAFVVLGAFSDRIRNMIAGATNAFGGTAEAVQAGQTVTDTKALQGDGTGIEGL